ncbi:MAG TPA: diguanylate cyclase [Cyanobacteria bacterium UBA11369]|nr:diguanylate cyclase [Cyanobacteria bacterium UBA11371]HBE33360.1 diguanylate cyclase [Cyanobacteria bacterium UBA11368]HBE54003.1 diguanylate cyclase [Cyanobacteria bacterium UBA11369]
MMILPTFSGEMPVEFPSGPVPLESNLYIERSPIEQLIYQEISKPGSVIRIKAPKQMGKSSLLLRLLHQAEQLNYRTAYIDFLQAENEVFSCLDKFLRWFCANVSRQLQLPPMLDDYWDEDIGSKVSCTIYFQGYLLEQINTPLVLAFNEVNRMFEHPNIAEEFLSLLRSWYEEAKQHEILQKLRIVLVHSTEVYIKFNINQSPFNVGLPIKLPEFNLEQVICLAGRYGLDWTDGNDAKKLMAMVGGHPYLVKLALYHLVKSRQNLDTLLEEAPNINGIYRDHLRANLVLLQKHPELAMALKQVIASEEEAKIDAIVAYKLESMGLVKLEGNTITLACNLYRQFFAAQRFEPNDLQKQIEQLQKQIKKLQQVSHKDQLTQVANRSYFEINLQQAWKNLAEQIKPVSLILCEIDFFKVYNDRQGEAAGDNCLRQVAWVIRNYISSKDNLIARYNWSEFAIFLPGIEDNDAFKIAEKLRVKVKQLAIPYNLSQMGGFPSSVISLSLGVASTIANLEKSPEILVRAANEALYEAKRNGCDRTEFFSSLNSEIANN